MFLFDVDWTNVANVRLVEDQIIFFHIWSPY